MFSHALIVARKEIRDHLRDTRSLVSSAFYALMGPLVVGMVSIAVRGEKSSAVLLSMASVFVLVATFVGGMNIAMDSIAGERERRSLLPLLMNPLLRRDVVLGKWLAISSFALTGVMLNLLGFAIVVGFSFRLLIVVLDYLRSNATIWPAVTYFALWSVRLAGFLPDLRVSAESRAIADEMLITPVHALAPRLWTRETATDLRRLLNRMIEEHVERNLRTTAILETL